MIETRRAVPVAAPGRDFMATIYPVLVMEGAKTFLRKGGNGPNGLALLGEVVGEVFGVNAPSHAANDILALCRQKVRRARH